MERAYQLFAVSFILILLTAGVTYRLTLNSVETRLDDFETQFTSMQSQVDSKQTTVSAELGALRRDLEANTDAIRQAFGEKFTQLEQAVSVTQQQSETQLSTALADIIASVKDVQQRSTEVERKVQTVAADNGDFSGVVEQATSSVLSIQAGMTIGSGFFITPEGLVVTNFHVVQGAPDIKLITSNKVTYRATLLSYDEAADLALLRLVTPSQDFPFLQFANSDEVEAGEPVVAIGSPGGYKFSVSKGVISSKERRDSGIDLFQLDISINPGNSGGPVLDRRGKVVGIAVGYRELEVFGLERMGFAIQSNFAKQKIDKMREQVFSQI